MKNEVDKKGKGNLGQESGNSFAVPAVAAAKLICLCLNFLPDLQEHR